MLLNINCEMQPTIKVHLTFDDNSTKDRIVAVGDLVAVEYNANGRRNRIDGKVIKISAVGTDPKAWYMIVDGSDDFDSYKAKFSPVNILDLDILVKGDSVRPIVTPTDSLGIAALRIVNGVLEYSLDGVTWDFVQVKAMPSVVRPEHYIPNIMPEEGTYPTAPGARPARPNPGYRPVYVPPTNNNTSGGTTSGSGTSTGGTTTGGNTSSSDDDDDANTTILAEVYE